jgi:hypothetical protein
MNMAAILIDKVSPATNEVEPCLYPDFEGTKLTVGEKRKIVPLLSEASNYGDAIESDDGK